MLGPDPRPLSKSISSGIRERERIMSELVLRRRE